MAAVQLATPCTYFHIAIGELTSTSPANYGSAKGETSHAIILVLASVVW